MYVSIDIEADGPIPGDYSMLSIGAVVINPSQPHFANAFYRKLAPISSFYNLEALKYSGFERDETIGFDNPIHVMRDFKDWLELKREDHNGNKKIMFLADNAGFDWMFICWYFHHFIGENPFGYSCTSLTSLFKGISKNMSKSFKHLRKTKHTHNALDDAMGNAEAFIKIIDKYDLKINL